VNKFLLGFFQVVDVPALQILKDFHDEDIGFVPQELGKHCVGNFVPPEALILMNSFEKTNSHSPACVHRQADGHSFVSPGKRASEPDIIIPNATSTSSTSTSTNAPVPQIQEQSAEGIDQTLENIVPDIRIGAFENDQQIAEAIKLTLSLCEQTKLLLDQAQHCGVARLQDKAQRIYDAIKCALSTLMKFQQAQ